MIGFLHNLTKVLAAVAALLIAPLAWGANINPGGTLNPCPAGTYPSIGATTERTGTVDFTITLGGFPIPLRLSGSIEYRVIRLSDNTLVFVYIPRTATNSNNVGAIGSLTFPGFDGFTTDVAYISGTNGTFAEAPERVTRSLFGGNSVSFLYDFGIGSPGGVGRTIFIRTDATSFRTSGTATVCSTGDQCLTLRGFPYPVLDSTPPVVALTAPATFASVCNPVTVTGSASDSGGFDSYTVDYATATNGPWTTIATGNTSVTNATLATWDTTSVPQGYAFLRLSAVNTSGLTNSVTNIVFVDKQFDTIELRSPGAGQILGGSICFDGTVSDANSSASLDFYTISYAPLPANSPYLPVNPATPQYTTTIINDGLGSWTTSSGPAAVADGPYRLRFTGRDQCGHTRTLTRDVLVDNTRPIAIISSPSACETRQGIIQVRGTATDANIAGWTLQYSGGDASQWVTIASGSSNVVDGVLGNFNTNGLRPCAYQLRLLVGDRAAVNCGSTNNHAEFLTSINVGCPADLDDGSGTGASDGGVTLDDLLYYLLRYDSGC